MDRRSTCCIYIFHSDNITRSSLRPVGGDAKEKESARHNKCVTKLLQRKWRREDKTRKRKWENYVIGELQRNDCEFAREWKSWVILPLLNQLSNCLPQNVDPLGLGAATRFSRRVHSAWLLEDAGLRSQLVENLSFCNRDVNGRFGELAVVLDSVSTASAHVGSWNEESMRSMRISEVDQSSALNSARINHKNRADPETIFHVAPWLFQFSTLSQHMTVRRSVTFTARVKKPVSVSTKSHNTLTRDLIESYVGGNLFHQV